MKDLVLATFLMGVAFSALLYRSRNIGFRTSRVKALSTQESRELNLSLKLVSAELKAPD